MKRAQTPLILLGFILLQLLTFWPFFAAPIHGDPGVYAYAADRMLQGDVLYRDVWNVKPPGIFFQFLFAFSAFGKHETAAYLVDWLMAVCIGLLILSLGRRLGSAYCGVFALFAWGAMYLRFFYGGWYGQPETPSLLAALLLAQIAVASGPLRLCHKISLGFLLAVLFWYKSPLLLFSGVLLLRWRKGRKEIPSRLLSLFGPVLVGAAVPTVAILAYFAFNHALSDLYQAVVILPPSLAAITRPPVSWQVSHFGLGLWELVTWSPVSMALAAFGTILVGRKLQTGIALPILLLSLGLAIVVVQARYFEYHWLAVLPGVALLAGIGAARLLQLAPKSFSLLSVLSIILIACLYIGSYSGIWFFWNGYLRSATKEAYWKWLPSNYGSDQHRLGADIGPTLAKWIKKPIPPDEYLLAFDQDGALNFYSQRRAPSRFLYLWHLKSRKFVEMGWTQEFAEDVIRKRPRAIVVCREARTPWGIRDELPILQKWPKLGEWFKENYILVPSYSYPPQGKQILETYRLKDLE